MTIGDCVLGKISKNDDQSVDDNDIIVNRKYKDYVYRKMLVQEYLKKYRIFKKVKPKNDLMYQDIYNCICQNTENKTHYPLYQIYSPTAV